jgi:Regulator of chromosome condensation (RCC1) repeat
MNSTANIGDNELPTTNVNLGVTATAISVGRTHVCALLNAGAVRCWGSSPTGQVGLGNTLTIGDNEHPTTNVNLGAATATGITTGTEHTCALLNGGSLRCWGGNGDGQLGLGNTNTIGDNENPTTDTNLGTSVGPSASLGVTISAPTVGQVFNSVPIVAIGTAFDDTQVTSVSLAIYRSVGGGQYWNGASWQSANTTVPATLTTPGGPLTGWSYTFNAPPGGTFAIAALAYDNNSNNAVAGYQTFRVNDGAFPTVSLSSPTPSQNYLSRPIPISGVATDDAGVGEVRIVIYRAVGAGEFWNGSAWQSAYAAVSATLASPGSTSTTFTYGFNPPQPFGDFYAAATVLDTSNNYSDTPFAAFRLIETVAPNITLSSPTPAQAFALRPVTISGTATDNAAVDTVLLAIYRPVGAGQFWNGVAWQSSYTTSTTFTYSFSPPQSGGYFYVAAIVIDTSYNYNLTPFTAFTLPDATPPTANMLNPNPGTYSGQLTINGNAADNVALNAVGIAIYRTSTGQYWNGTAWQAGFTTVPATVTAAGDPTTGFVMTYTPPAPGTYLIAALPIDTNYNYSLTPWVTINYT